LSTNHRGRTQIFCHLENHDPNNFIRKSHIDKWKVHSTIQSNQ
jgi:hypothetical protein